MVYDAITFFNELEVLELRLATLYDRIDRFVIVEAHTTHSGKTKDLNFLNNLKLFAPFCDKIYYVPVYLPNDPDRWMNENAQRNGILAGLHGLQPADIVLVSDCDEIPDLTSWNGNEGVFSQQHSYYKYNMVHPDPWNGTVAIAGWRFASPYGRVTPQDCRNFRDVLRPCGTGWHFGWIGDKQTAIEKIENFGHSELDSTEYKENFSNLYGKVHPSDGRTLLKFDLNTHYFPEYLKQNQERFQHNIVPMEHVNV